MTSFNINHFLGGFISPNSHTQWVGLQHINGKRVETQTFSLQQGRPITSNEKRLLLSEWLPRWLSGKESVLMRWMKLEPIIQNEVSQKEKHQYSILTHIYGI